MLKIFDVGLGADASSVLRSMLKVVESRSVVKWRQSSLDQAQVLIAHVDSDPELLAAWQASGKPVVIIVEAGSRPIAWPFVLRQPFRVMQLLATLDCVAEHVRGNGSPIAPDDRAWVATQSLRELLGNSTQSGWHFAADATSPDPDNGIWVRRDQAFAQPQVRERLRTRKLSLATFAPTSIGAPGSALAMPLADLGWLAGLNTPDDLAPWLQPDMSYRLRRWPDLGRVGASDALIELCALASAKADLPASLAQKSGYAPSCIHHFLAAASLAGLLTADSNGPTQSNGKSAAAGARGWLRLVNGLRRHLRLDT